MSRIRLTKISAPTTASSYTTDMYYDTSLSKIAAVDGSSSPGPYTCYFGGFLTADYRAVRVLEFTANGTYIPLPGSKAAFFEAVGGGGAGGGGATSSSTASVGGGGGGGAYSCARLTSASANWTGSYAIAVGAGGTAGAAGAAGGNGGNSSVTNTAGTVVAAAYGGTGGPVLAAGTSITFQAGGAGGAASSGTGDMKVDGGQGFQGVRLSGTVAWGGCGSGSLLCPEGGGGAAGATGGSAGGAATASGYGSAGGGGATLSTSCVGGAGIQGIVRIWEFA